MHAGGDNNPNPRERKGTDPILQRIVGKNPHPHPTITAFQNDLIDPLDLIIAIKTAANDFNDAHKATEVENFEDTKEGAEDFVKWLYTIHLGLIQDTQLSVEPDNKELVSHLEEHHRLCILPLLDLSNYSAQGNIGTNSNVLSQLIEATNCNNKVCEEKQDPSQGIQVEKGPQQGQER
jgi:hypothetical protein